MWVLTLSVCLTRNCVIQDSPHPEYEPMGVLFQDGAALVEACCISSHILYLSLYFLQIFS